jgi:ubiquinone/menaquinone biosynthesis C-methylase UbiE
MTPYDAAVFDSVVAYWSLIHVPLSDHQTVLEGFERVLCPGGRVLPCEGTNEWTGENPDWLDSGVEMQWETAGAETTRNRLHAAGFTIVDSWGPLSELEDDRAVEKEEVDDSP